MRNPEQNHQNEQHEQTSDEQKGQTPWDALKRVPFRGYIDRKYAALERPLVDKKKASFAEDIWHSSIDATPREISRLEKAKRLLATSPALRRVLPKVASRALTAAQRDADLVAAHEHHEETVERDRQRRLADERLAEENRRQHEAWLAEQARLEQERLDRQLIEAMDVYRINGSPSARARQERLQEIGERAFNAGFTKVEDIEAEADITPEVELMMMESEGKQVPVYILHGRHLNCLLHAIDFKGRGGQSDANRIGSATAKRLQDDPSFWLNTGRTESSNAGKPENQGRQTQTNTGTSTTLSATWLDTSRNYKQVDRTDLWDYGFVHMPAGSLISAHLGDAATPQTEGRERLRPNLSQTLYSPEQMSPRVDKYYYNELWMNRYDEDHKPILPDFCLTSSGDGSHIPETMLRHAAFFGIPVFSIDQSAYKKKESARVAELVPEIPEDKPYEEILPALDDIADSASTNWNIKVDQNIGSPARVRNDADIYLGSAPKEQVEHLLALELEKRMDYLRRRLASETEAVRAATAADQNFDTSAHGIYTINHCTTKTHHLEYDGRLDLRLNIGGQSREFWIHNGHHLSEHHGPYTKALPPDAPDYYADLAPLVDDYLAAIKENQSR